MKEQFEEISEMLDKVVGGQNLFGIDTETEGRESCTTLCFTKCERSVGSVSGSTRGTLGPSSTEMANF